MAEKGVQVNATVPKDWDKAIEDHRWTVRMTKTQVVRVAVEEYMVNHGLARYNDAAELELTTPNQGETQPDIA